MKHLLLTYLGCIAVIFILPTVLAMIPSPENSSNSQAVVIPLDENSRLPKEINVYFTDEGVTRAIDFEEYIKGVLPAEMPALFEPEAQKAQAVSARTYAYYKYLNYIKDPSSASPDHPDAAICTSPTHCNAYYSKEKLIEKHGKTWADEHLDRIRSYVDETRGEILIYEDEPILAVFHSSSAGGMTESSGDVWAKDLPYLVSVKSVGEDQRDGFITTVSVSREEFTSKITEHFADAVFPDDTSSWIGKIIRTRGNHIGSIEIGGVSIKGTQVRSIFELRSTCFTVSIDESNVTFTVEGNGHGVGMSQYGANIMAKNGADYKEILENYYSGAKIVRY